MRRLSAGRALAVASIIATSLLAVSPAIARAQSVPASQAAPRDSVAMPQRLFAINPFLLLWGNAQAEYEQRISVRSSFAVAGSFMRFGSDIRYNNVDAKLRFYPAERALSGLGVAAGVGVGQLRRDLSYYTCAGTGFSDGCFEGKSVVTAPTLSMEGTYQWLLGRQRATAVTIGFGAKRYFASREDFRSEWRTWPTGRLTIGRGF